MIEAVVVGAAALLALVYVIAPLRRGRVPIADAPDDVAEAQSDKRAKLGALLELEEERFAGKMSTADFELLRRQYEAEAVEALKHLDSVADKGMDDDELEAEIARVKSSLRCPACGAPRGSATSCPECGV